MDLGETLGAPATHRMSKQAKQRTASTSAIYLLRVCDPLWLRGELLRACASVILCLVRARIIILGALIAAFVNVRGAQAA